ncbi:MAG: RagB/SusD family nutrient uptake outer membrane protein [Bacteroidales bacterium]|nr:RagB/SusD family nutrient uptake outer membrane protein [Bacteroidales bacterium]
MKKIFAIFSALVLLVFAGCQKDFLETNPTDRVSGPTIFADSENAMTAVNGLIRLLYVGGWGSSWGAENGGLPAYILVQDLKGEDHVMDGQGSGWFYYDYAFDTFGDWTGNAGHQYQVWNFFYTLISNANYILANQETMEGDVDYKNYALGQAYAIRSFCYMWLVQTYQQNGAIYGTSLPGVPLYTEPTVAGSEGKGRGTVADVYAQANADIDAAIQCLSQSSLGQLHKSHISLAAAYGIKARHALVQHDYATALAAAESAMKGQKLGSWGDIQVVNSVDKPNVLWGLAIQTDQAMGNYDIYNHMDADCLSTYAKARHLIGNWLYDEIPDTDVRKAWWTAPIPEAQWGVPGSANGSYRSWCQKKLVYLNATAQTGDHILLRTEELYLIAAEAACEAGDYAKARQYVSAVGSLRDTNYAARLKKMTDDKTLNQNTTGPIVTLMDEIFFQRRVELWSENPRLFDLQRRGLAYNRNWAGTNHTSTATAFTQKPGSANFILWIPQSEFDGNENMDAERDQNPKQGRGL